eukprot:scaffold1149_cov380-Prasinococcus_capsulatus_cf.AAC.3
MHVHALVLALLFQGAPDFSEYLLKTAIATLRDIHKRNLDSVLALNLGLGVLQRSEASYFQYLYNRLPLDSPDLPCTRQGSELWLTRTP